MCIYIYRYILSLTWKRTWSRAERRKERSNIEKKNGEEIWSVMYPCLDWQIRECDFPPADDFAINEYTRAHTP